jgi:hypothetical protein
MRELVDANGVILRRDAVAHGYDDNYLARLVKAREIVRLRQGAYVLTEIWRAASDVDRHLILAGAVMRQYRDEVALSHISACLEQGGPNWGLDLGLAHVTNLFGIGERTAAKVRHHRGRCLVGDLSRVNNHWITAPPRTALDTASLVTRDPGVAILDWFLNSGMTTREQLEEGFASMKEWPNTLRLHRQLQLCDGRSESVGETRTRLLCLDQGLPAPEPQFHILHPSGRVAGRVDFAWPDRRLMLEFDGRQKYHRHRHPGETVEQMVLREKAREDVLRELTGWILIRLVWADLDVPVRTAQRIRRAMQLVAA